MDDGIVDRPNPTVVQINYREHLNLVKKKKKKFYIIKYKGSVNISSLFSTYKHTHRLHNKSFDQILGLSRFVDFSRLVDF